MGYVTEFSLKIDSGNVDVEGIIAFLREESMDARHVLDAQGASDNNGRWNGRAEELLRFSKKHPDVLFCLRGSGEDRDDFWEEFYRDGRTYTHKAVVSFPDFDPHKLKWKHIN